MPDAASSPVLQIKFKCWKSAKAHDCDTGLPWFLFGDGKISGTGSFGTHVDKILFGGLVGVSLGSGEHIESKLKKQNSQG